MLTSFPVDPSSKKLVNLLSDKNLFDQTGFFRTNVPRPKKKTSFEEKNIVSYFCFDLLTLFLMLRFKNLE